MLDSSKIIKVLKPNTPPDFRTSRDVQLLTSACSRSSRPHQGSAPSCLPRPLTSAHLDLTQARHQTTSALHNSTSTLYLGSQASTLDSCVLLHVAYSYALVMACLDLYSALFGLCSSLVVVGPPSSREPCTVDVGPTSGAWPW
mgnify:CR=1 FL=1